MKFDKVVLSEGGILLIICLVFACYYKSVNKLIGGSNCSEISCCGCSLKRQPLSEEAALEVMNNQPRFKRFGGRVLMRSILTIMLETKNQLEKCYY